MIREFCVRSLYMLRSLSHWRDACTCWDVVVVVVVVVAWIVISYCYCFVVQCVSTGRPRHDSLSKYRHRTTGAHNLLIYSPQSRSSPTLRFYCLIEKKKFTPFAKKFPLSWRHSVFFNYFPIKLLPFYLLEVKFLFSVVKINFFPHFIIIIEIQLILFQFLWVFATIAHLWKTYSRSAQWKN